VLYVLLKVGTFSKIGLAKNKIIANRWQQGPETLSPQHILLAQNEELWG